MTASPDPPSAPERPPAAPWLDEQPGPHRRGFRRRRRWIALIAVGAALIGTAAGGISWFRFSVERQLNQVGRMPDPFVSIPASERPPKPRSGRTFLVAGLDTLAEERGDPGRSDALMVVRVAADHRWLYVISIPRDAWVPIPGHGMGKINSAYALGGPTLAVRTVERLTGLRIEHFAAVDMTGFRDLTDAVGGVSVTIPDRPGAGAGVLPPGRHQLTGEQALAYVRERKGLPEGDLDRVKRQQNYLRELMLKALDRDVLTNPARVNSLLRAAFRTVRVDRGLTTDIVREVLMQLGGMQVLFVTAPVDGTGRVGDQSVVRLDDEQAPPFWAAVRGDRLKTHLRGRQWADELGAVVN